jgi:hypothetical protein
MKADLLPRHLKGPNDRLLPIAACSTDSKQYEFKLGLCELRHQPAADRGAFTKVARTACAIAIRVSLKDQEWLPDMQLRRGTTKIDRLTKALDGVCLVHIKDIDRSKIENKALLASLRRVGNHFLVRKEKLVLLGVHLKDLQQRVIGKFGNAFSVTAQIAISSRRSYILGSGLN